MLSLSRALFVGVGCLFASTSVCAQSAYVSFTGDFPTAGDQHNFIFDLTRPVASGEELRFETFANGGGSNEAGEIITAGGIDSVLELFDQIEQIQRGKDDDGSFTPGLDSLLSWPGVAETDDIPLNPDPLPIARYFLNLSKFGNDGTGHWALDLVGPDDALLYRGDASLGTSMLGSLIAGEGAIVIFSDSYELNSGRSFTFQSGARFTVDEFLDIGNGSDGLLILEDAGTTLTTNVVATTFLDWGEAGGKGEVYLRDGATANIQATHINLGADTNTASQGSLNVQTGSQLTVNTLNLGTINGGSGTIVVNGTDSIVTQNGTSVLTISNGSLDVYDGGQFTSGNGPINVNGSGRIWIGNVGSAGGTFNANGDLTVASDRFGLAGVELQGDSQFNSLDVNVGSNAANGSILIDGYPTFDTLWTVTGSMTVGSGGFGSGLATITSGGRLDVSNDLTVAGSMDATGTLMTIARAHITVGGQLMIGAFGTVGLLDGPMTSGELTSLTTESLIVDPQGTLDHQIGTIAVDGGQFTIQLGTLTIDSTVGSPTLRLENGAQGMVVNNQGVSPIGKEGVIIVGEEGEGHLEIGGGSYLTSGAGWIGNSDSYPGMGNGRVEVRGILSTWEITAEAEQGALWTTPLSVGTNGDGRLSILSGGQVIVRSGQVSFGSPFYSNSFGQGSPGVGVVDGTGSRLRVEGDDQLPGVLGIGALDPSTGASGMLSVSNGGRVEVHRSTVVEQAGTLLLTSSGSVQTENFTVESGGVFTHNDGVLTVDGGLFDPGILNETIDGATQADLPVVELINGATATLSGDLIVGNSNRGKMEMLSGGYLSLPDSGATLHLGTQPGGDGEVVVNGVGSTGQSFLATDAGFIIGEQNIGTLRVQGGAAAGDYNGTGSILGLMPGAQGYAQVASASPAGLRSTWSVGGGLLVGVEGVGSLSVDTGGLVIVHGDALVGAFAGSGGSHVTVSATHAMAGPSTWQVGGSLLVGGDDGTFGPGDNASVSVLGGAKTIVNGDLRVWGDSTIIVDAASQMEVGSGAGTTGTLTVHNGGSLMGDGAVHAAVHNDGGSVSPGSSSGALTIQGSYVQTVNGVLNIEIGGTLPAEFDQLHIPGGAAALAGVLEVSLIDPLGGGNIFTPSAGDTYEILTAGELLGTFTTEMFPSIPGKPGLQFLIDYDTTLDRVLLSVAPYFQADFDEDGDVDGDDLTAWQSGYTIGTSHTSGDANGNGDVDGNDFLIWQRQLGSMAGGSTTAVPEPRALALLIFASINIFLGRCTCTRSGFADVANT